MGNLKGLGLVVVLLVLLSNPALAVQEVTTEEIADGAVTDSKISGPISASKIQEGFFAKKVDQTIVVAKSSGDFRYFWEAIDYINANPSSYVHYVIKLMPGTYETGNEYRQWPSNITIVGSGIGSTLLQGWARYDAIGGTSKPALTLNGGEVRDLAIGYERKTSTNPYHKTTGAVLLATTGDAVVENVRIYANNGLSSDTRLISAGSGNLKLKNIEALFSYSSMTLLDLVNTTVLIDGVDAISSQEAGSTMQYPQVIMKFDDNNRRHIRIRNSVFGDLYLDSPAGSWSFFDIDSVQTRALTLKGTIDVKLKNSQVDMIYNQGSNYPSNLKLVNCFTSNLDSNIIFY